MNKSLISCLLFALCFPTVTLGENLPGQALREYFAAETQRIANASLADISTVEAWEQQRPQLRKELLEMLGLSPLPKRSPLQATTTATRQRDGVTVENIHFQSRPGLYVTANLYRPTNSDGRKLPTIVYGCGHARVAREGISFGNKAHYQHHGAWFARNGYVCLVLDTIQLGELEGIHHGTYREKMWWWLSQGYTPAGVEAWNIVRAIDYLETRGDVDANKIGITGRSGGGAYSWWAAAIDERIQVIVPVAGITDLRNHVVDGTVEGHCDCMFMLNTYRWDYDRVAALLAPRPLLISNTDRDPIFPLDGVYRIYRKVRQLYELYGAGDDIALHITAGPHQDTQELRIHAFRWFNHYLKNDDSLISDTARPVFATDELKVFEQLPDIEVTTSAHHGFVKQSIPETVPSSLEALGARRDRFMRDLTSRVFAGWPAAASASSWTRASSTTHRGYQLEVYDFESQPHVPLRVAAFGKIPANTPPKTVRLVLQDDHAWNSLLNHIDAKQSMEAIAAAFEIDDEWIVFFSPRGMGSRRWEGTEKTWTQIRRRFYLLGQTLDGMRVYDILRAIDGLQNVDHLHGLRIRINGRGRLGALGLYASLYAPQVDEVCVSVPPTSDKEDPFLLNVRRFADLPDVVAMCAIDRRVQLLDVLQTDRWQAAINSCDALGIADRLQIIEENHPVQRDKESGVSFFPDGGSELRNE